MILREIVNVVVMDQRSLDEAQSVLQHDHEVFNGSRVLTDDNSSDGRIRQKRFAEGVEVYSSQGLPRASKGRSNWQPSRWLRCGPMIMSTVTAASLRLLAKTGVVLLCRQRTNSAPIA